MHKQARHSFCYTAPNDHISRYKTINAKKRQYRAKQTSVDCQEKSFSFVVLTFANRKLRLRFKGSKFEASVLLWLIMACHGLSGLNPKTLSTDRAQKLGSISLWALNNTCAWGQKAKARSWTSPIKKIPRQIFCYA